jgi:hypothetical protein
MRSSETLPNTLVRLGGLLEPMSGPLGWAGVLGGLLYLLGDLLFYGGFGAGSEFSSLSTMAGRSDAVLVAGGIVAPLASAAYVLGTAALAVEAMPAYPRAAFTGLVSWTGMFSTGIAYHAVYATRGFATKLSEPSAGAMLERIRLLLSSLYAMELGFGVLGTLALGYVLFKRAGGHPRWLLLLMPTAWALAADLAAFIPAPVGALVRGMWINGAFVVFFGAAAVARARPGTRAC